MLWWKSSYLFNWRVLPFPRRDNSEIGKITSLVNDHTDSKYQQKGRYSKGYVNGSLWYVVLWKMNSPISNGFDRFNWYVFYTVMNTRYISHCNVSVLHVKVRFCYAYITSTITFKITNNIRLHFRIIFFVCFDIEIPVFVSILLYDTYLDVPLLLSNSEGSAGIFEMS